MPTNFPIPAALVERFREEAQGIDHSAWVYVAKALARAFLDGQREGLKEAAELAATCGASSFYIASDAVEDIVERLRAAVKCLEK